MTPIDITTLYEWLDTYKSFANTGCKTTGCKYNNIHEGCKNCIGDFDGPSMYLHQLGKVIQSTEE
jgi:hypothetical protein